MKIATTLFVVLSMFGMIRAADDESAAMSRYRENYVIPVSLKASQLEFFDVFRGEKVYVEVEYLAQPGGQVLFAEPAEQVWWVQDKPLLLLGSTGLPLPFEVVKRKQVFVQVYVFGDALFADEQKLFPRKDGFEVDADASSLKEKLQSRMVGVDGSYLSQVANYLAMNLAGLDVRGETLTIDTHGWFGGTVDMAGFRMATGAVDGRVLTCDAGGNASWQDAGGGFSLPYYGSGSSAAALFTLDQNGLGETMVLTADNAGCDLPCLRMTSNNRGPTLFSSNAYQSDVLYDQANAGYFQASNSASAGAALFAESFSNANGMAVAGMQKGGHGSAAFFETTNINNGAPALFAGTMGTGRAFEAVNYHDASGDVASFKMDKSTNPGHVVVAETPGAGTVFQGTNTGSGKVAEFAITDIASTATVLDVSSAGEGIVAQFENPLFGASGVNPVIKTVSNQLGPALHAINTSGGSGPPGTGSAAVFECTSTSSFADQETIVVTSNSSSAYSSCVWAQHTGTGTAGIFDNANTTDGGIGLKVFNESINHPALKVENRHGGADAAEFIGDVHVNGTLSKNAGSFRIDHPLDPEHKYLQHSFVESPDMMNIYNGLVTLDAHGEAWVELPDWFEALNRSFRYQITAIGQPAPNLYIAHKIDNLKFQIAGGQPHQEVSWQVTGIRQDKYALDHPIQTEVDKPADAVGKYVYPQGYGADRSAGIGGDESVRPGSR